MIGDYPERRSRCTMKTVANRPADDAELRRQAEEIAQHKAAQSPENVASMSLDETRRVLHELQVHQIELDLQNEELRRTQAELDASRARYFDLYDLAPVGYVTLSEHGLLLETNLAATILLGVVRSQLVKRRLSHFIVLEDRPSYYRHCKQLFETGKPQTWEMRLLKQLPPQPNHPEQYTHHPLWVNAKASMAQDAEGAPVCRVVINDISERMLLDQRVRDQQFYTRSLIEANIDAMITTDSRGIITDANKQMESLTGCTRDELIGAPFKDYFTNPERAEAVITLVLDKGKVADYELTARSRDGRETVVSYNATTFHDRDRRLQGVVAVARDVTERSRLERQMQLQAAELSDLHRRKDEFLAMLSHELRSPLAPIANAVQLLGLQRGSESPIQQQARGIIERQMGQLQHLVDDLLEVSRITTGRVQLRREHVAVSGIVEVAVETARPLIEQRRHELTVSLPPERILLHADAARLEQVVVNLLTNAAKYTEEGGHVWLTVQQEGEECVLRVRDTGPGIAPALLPRIFDLFTQAKRSLDRSQGGLGIGLALVQRLTELHGGKVEACSTLGKGSEFVVRLPVAPTNTPPSRSSVTETGQPATRPLRVLLVDDNVDTVLSFSLLLEACGHHVRTARDGLEAVQAALDYRPDLVLLDIGLPGLNGYEVAKRLRQDPGFANVVLVAVTGYGQNADRQASMEAGFNHHLVKPARLEQLQRILAAVSEKVT